MQQQSEAECLTAAISGLLPFRPLPALRHALRVLVDAADDAPEDLGSRPPANARAAPPRRFTVEQRAEADPQAVVDGWPELRRQLIEQLQTRGVTRAELAEAVGLKTGSLKNFLAPAGKPPGPAVIARFRTWLDTPEVGAAEVDPAPVATFRRSDTNGAGAEAAAGP